jgi:hypothetical protein
LIHAQATANAAEANPRIPAQTWAVRDIACELVRRCLEHDDECPVVEELGRRGAAVVLVRNTPRETPVAVRSNAYQSQRHGGMLP